MTAAAMNAWIAEALALVPRERGLQTDFRMVLATMLKNALGRRPENAMWSVAQVVSVAAQRAGGDPIYDRRLLALEWPPGRSARS